MARGKAKIQTQTSAFRVSACYHVACLKSPVVNSKESLKGLGGEVERGGDG